MLRGGKKLLRIGIFLTLAMKSGKPIARRKSIGLGLEAWSTGTSRNIGMME
jgi:hypothetical protein